MSKNQAVKQPRKSQVDAYLVEVTNLFSTYDTDNNGKISRGELKQLLKDVLGKANITVTDEVVERHEERFDVNGDGIILKDEFTTTLIKYISPIDRD
jgi:Ca2+-binding EF-hand superfamily protein